MEYFKHLKEKFPFYLSSGIICAILLFMVIVLNSYSGHIDKKLFDLRKISTNKEKITRQVKEIDAVTVYLKNEFGLDASDINPNVLISAALDEIKKNLADSTIMVSSFRDSGDGSTHNIDIEMPIKNYSMLVQRFQYLESFRIPKYKINNFTLSKGNPGEMVLNIYGSFVMPSL